MMHRLIRFGSVTVMIVGLLFSSGIAEAHVLKQDNGYSAVLHIDPDDEPLAGQTSRLNLLIDTEAGGFSQNQYRLALTVSENGKVLQHLTAEPAEFGDANDSFANFTFPKTDVYTLELVGTRLADNMQQFHMTYIVRVAGYAPGAGQSTHNNYADKALPAIGAGVVGFGALIAVGSTMIRRGKRYVPKRQS